MPELRGATEGDLDAIVWIAVAAFRTDPTYTYRFPYIDQYLDEYTSFIRKRYKLLLASPHVTVMVYELPTNEDASVAKPVAYSVWPPVMTPAASQVNPQSLVQQPFAVPERVAVVQADIDAAKERLFLGPYGDAQVFLGLLACHPDYQRRGAAKALLSWGIEKARSESKTVTLFATPTGSTLYRRMGFHDAEIFYTKVSGDSAVLEQKAMVLEFSTSKDKA
ncbi:acyl-CoA N-acyltransferase [Xylariaceae sp. FL1019]|nr:acyl-CoA N-acyltransferase [Xylariaceae sp. FL1019]